MRRCFAFFIAAYWFFKSFVNNIDLMCTLSFIYILVFLYLAYFVSAGHSHAGVLSSACSALFPVVFGSRHLCRPGGTTGQIQLLLHCRQLLLWIKYF